jgi:hypothetical protein
VVQIIKELTVDVTKPNVFQAVVAKQYDMNTRFLKVTFADCGNKIEIPLADTNKVVINAERNDGQSKGFEGSINDDGTVTVPLHSWMLELDGTVICDISVICGTDKKLTTTSFTLIVEKAAFGGSDITSDPQFDVLVQLLETCNTASVAAEEALQKSMEANSKYDACVEATENANAVRKEIEAGGYIESLKEINHGEKFTTWIGTEEEYDDMAEKPHNCLCITVDDDPQVDYVVEEGTSGIWTYRKWTSGIAECWGSETVSFQPKYPWGSVYAETVIDQTAPNYGGVKLIKVNYPTGLFTSIISSSVDLCLWGNLLQACRFSCLVNEQLTYSPIAYSKYDEILEPTAHYTVIGRWK